MASLDTKIDVLSNENLYPAMNENVCLEVAGLNTERQARRVITISAQFFFTIITKLTRQIYWIFSFFDSLFDEKD